MNDVICPYCSECIIIDECGCMHFWCKHVDIKQRKQGFDVPFKSYKNPKRITEIYKELHNLEAEEING